MRITLALLALAAATPALADERRYSVTDFDRIQVDGPYQVSLTTGGPASARATGSNAALNRLSIEVQGRTLRVRPNVSAWGGYPNAPTDLPAITVTTRTLDTAAVNGAGTLKIDKAKGLKFAVSLMGSGKATIGAVESDNLQVTMMGSGTIQLGGRAKSMRADVHGTASLDASALTAGDAQIIADTAGEVKLAVNRAVTVQANGSGDVAISGTPACTVKGNGAGQVSCGGR
jgi:hypothetical protein